MIQMRTNCALIRTSLTVVALLFLSATAQASEESDVRNLVQQTFQNLQSRNYSAVYDSLPSATQKRMSRARFTNALQRAQGRYTLDRISIGTIRVSGDLAVADTELFGRVTTPITAEGKIVVQQYLVREGGKWRVATGDNTTIQRFLKTSPAFARKFPIRQPRIYVKQGGQWVQWSMP
jgi:predicted alpha/beta-hydrolase family hydrolase